MVCGTSLAVSIPGVHAQQTSVPITFHRQENALSCEAVALKWEISSDYATRRWVTTPTLLQQRGGSNDRVISIDAATLSSYSMAAPIE